MVGKWKVTKSDVISTNHVIHLIISTIHVIHFLISTIYMVGKWKVTKSDVISTTCVVGLSNFNHVCDSFPNFNHTYGWEMESDEK